MTKAFGAHAAALKEASVCGAGCYNALSALELYVESFDAVGALAQLEGFASHHGPAFYGLPRNRGQLSLARQAWVLPARVRQFGAFFRQTLVTAPNQINDLAVTL